VKGGVEKPRTEITNVFGMAIDAPKKGLTDRSRWVRRVESKGPRGGKRKDGGRGFQGEGLIKKGGTLNSASKRLFV